MIWKKIHNFPKKNKNKLLLFKNQTSWKIYIFKIMYIKNKKYVNFFLNDIFLKN